MKIAFFTDNFLPQPSGVATSAFYFAQNLSKAGHTVYVFAPKVKGYQDKQKNVFRLPSIRFMPNLPDGARIPLPVPNKSFWKMVEFDVDIIHSHGNGAFSLLGLAVARAKKIPYVATFHIQVGSFAHYFLKGKLIKPKTMDKFFLKRFGNLCDGVVAPSEKMMQQLLSAGVTKDVRLIPNFVNLDTFKNVKAGLLRKKYRIPKDDPLILSCGRVGKEKNFEFLIRVFEKVVRIKPQAHLVIAGPDWGEMDSLKKLSKQLKIKDRVHFLGQVKVADMPKVYHDADLFVFPSTSEVHPMVAIEAAASSLPIIVPDDPAYKGVVVDGKNGFTLSLNEDIFVKSTLKLLNNHKLREKFGKASPKIIEKNFGADYLTKKALAFYNQIIRNFSNTP